MTTMGGQATPQPLSMPAGLPPAAPPDMQAASKIGGAPVNGGPAKIGASPAADAQAQMMKRAGVQPMPMSPMPAAQTGKAAGAGTGTMTKGKPAPVSRMEPKPNA